jgi:hypothetical protein
MNYLKSEDSRHDSLCSARELPLGYFTLWAQGLRIPNSRLTPRKLTGRNRSQDINRQKKPLYYLYTRKNVTGSCKYPHLMRLITTGISSCISSSSSSGGGGNSSGGGGGSSSISFSSSSSSSNPVVVVSKSRQQLFTWLEKDSDNFMVLNLRF